MTKILSFFCALTLSAVMIGGCANRGGVAGTGASEGTVGTVLGGIAGGAAGSQIGGEGTGNTIATVVGAVAGAALGRRIGQNMERSDRNRFGSALETNQTGNTSTWTNPDTDSQYAVTPTRTYQSGNQPCRKFTMDATVDGRPDKVHGTACRQADGSWKTQ